MTVTLTSDEGKTGNFEVFLGDALIHSKATKGQDKCESAASVIDRQEIDYSALYE